MGTRRNWVPKGPARRAVQTKLRPHSGAFPVRPTGEREPGPATRGAAHGTDLYVRGASGCGPPRHPAAACSLQAPAGLFSAGPAVGPRETKEPPPRPPRRVPSPRAPGPLPSASPEAARHPPAALRRQGPGQSPDLGCAAGQPRGRTHRCSTRTTGSRWGTWLSPGRCRRWS